MWNETYATPDYRYGTEPTQFLLDNAGLIEQGARVLCVADGEGRNGVWLAQQGCEVTSFDPSENAVAKAQKLAQRRGVSLNAQIADTESWDWDQPFDLVVACFIQFAGPPQQTQILSDLPRALRPGGRLMLHGYTPEQIEFGTGGPPLPEMTYTEDLLRTAFSDLTVLRLACYEKHLSEGTGHHGRSALIDLIADKPV
ncbi:MAG: class I SAM-dependent methyltransferase [Pelagimonas sp.]|jgi:SAM-dependent methyltransferase|nr:class I SAM-dependent methyltransferase [Pelagimonas sp.]